MKARDITYCFFDLETTGLQDDCDIIQFGSVVAKPGSHISIETDYTLYTDKKIDPEASGAHGLRNEDLMYSPPIEKVIDDILNKLMLADVLVAHNASFDYPIMKRVFDSIGKYVPQKPVIDTLRLARHLLPERTDHKLQTLFHLFEIERSKDHTSHRAVSDCRTLHRVFNFLLFDWEDRQQGDATIKELLALASSPVSRKVMPFGKFRGKPLAEIDTDWLEWWCIKRKIENPDEEDWELTYSLAKELHSRQCLPDYKKTQLFALRERAMKGLESLCPYPTTFV